MLAWFVYHFQDMYNVSKGPPLIAGLYWQHGLITNPSIIADPQDQSPEKNKRPISNNTDPGGQILKNK